GVDRARDLGGETDPIVLRVEIAVGRRRLPRTEREHAGAFDLVERVLDARALCGRGTHERQAERSGRKPDAHQITPIKPSWFVVCHRSLLRRKSEIRPGSLTSDI